MQSDSGPVHWHSSVEEDGGGTAAWLFSLAELPGGADPTPGDLRDVGARKGDDARRFLLRRAALRRLVARRCGMAPAAVEIGYDAAGRPLVGIAARSLFCSVSARQDVTALALADRPVGVDLEPMVAGEIPWSALHDREAARIRDLPGPERLAAFLRIWTVKEACLKARGSGLLADPAAIIVSGLDVDVDGNRIRLHPSALCRTIVESRTVMAACVALPR